MTKEESFETVSKIILFNILCILPMFSLYMFGLFIFKNQGVIPINKVGIMFFIIAKASIAWSLMLFAVSMIWAYRKSICYLFSAPNFIVAITAGWMYITFQKQLSNVATAHAQIKTQLITYLIAVAVAMALLIWNIIKYKSYSETKE